MLRRLLVFVLLLCSVGCRAHSATVVWISLDGYRFDYPDKTDTPLMQRMMREGAYSRDLVTITPSITFPSHVSEATGVAAGEHGILSNEFYDTKTKQLYKFPHDPSLLGAEPIWITAKRQRVRTAVYDWPLSYGTFRGVRPDYCYDKFEGKPSDQERLDALLATWESDRGKKPLRLLMGYVKRTDGVGHRFGPDSPEIEVAIRQTDAELGGFVDRAVELFKRSAKRGDELYVILTTDHGMMRVHTLVNVDKLFDPAPPKDVQIVTSGSLAQIYLDQVPASQRGGVMETMLRDLGRHHFVTTYTPETLPSAWRFGHPSRTGDIVLMLQPGYGFNRSHPVATSQPRANDSKGQHGYPVAGCPEMRGFCAIWRFPTSLGGRDLGEVRAEQLHPTVAKLLRIRPSPQSKAKPLAIP